MITYSDTPALIRTLTIAVAVALAGCSSSDDDDDGGTTDGGTTDGGTTDGGTTDGGTTDGGTTDGGTTDGGTTVVVPLSDVSGNVTQFGYVSIEQPGAGSGDEGGITGAFLRFDRAFPALDAIEGFQPPLDTCAVDTFTASEAPDDFDFDFDFQSLSAGEQLILTSSAGTYVELPRQQAFGFTLYQLDGESLPGPVPSGLVLDIPGDEYPAFASVSVPDVAQLTGVTPMPPTQITADSVFGWEAGSSSDAYVSISASTTSFAGGGISITSVDCLVIDDGEFAFPAQTRSELGDFSATSADVTRVGLTILRRGNALLFVGSESSGS